MKPMRFASFVAAIALTIAGLASNAYGQQFVYVATPGSNAVAGFNLNVFTGALTPIPGSPFSAGLIPGSVAVDQFGRFAYVANVGSNSVSAYGINPFNGALTEIAGSPFPVPGMPRSLAVDPGGRFVYVGESGGVSAFAVDFFSGMLTLVPGSPFAGGSMSSVVAHPSGRFVYAGDIESAGYFYTVNPFTGALTSVISGRLSPGGGPLALAMHPSGRFLYARNSVQCVPFAFCGLISAFAVDAITGFPFPSGQHTVFPAAIIPGNDIAIDGTGRFLYNTLPLVEFAINALFGTLAQIAAPPRASPFVATEPTGRFAFTFSNSGCLETNTINAFTGELTVLSCTSTGATPSAGKPAVTGVSWLAFFQ